MRTNKKSLQTMEMTTVEKLPSGLTLENKRRAFETASVYVGTYNKYNNGSIAGKWMNLSDYESKEDFYKACRELHKDEKDPEFMFQDWESVPRSFIGESSISENFFELKNAIEDSYIDDDVYMELFDYGYIDENDDPQDIVSRVE